MKKEIQMAAENSLCGHPACVDYRMLASWSIFILHLNLCIFAMQVKISHTLSDVVPTTWSSISDHQADWLQLVLCEYSKFRIESNTYFSIRFETSTIIPNFQILTVTNFLLI